MLQFTASLSVLYVLPDKVAVWHLMVPVAAGQIFRMLLSTLMCVSQSCVGSTYKMGIVPAVHANAPRKTVVVGVVVIVVVAVDV